MKFISKPNPYADVYRYVSNIAHDYSNEAVQQIRISIVNGMIRNFKFAYDDDVNIYVLINFDDNPYYLEWASPKIQDVFNLIALFKGVKLDEDDWDDLHMVFCDYIHSNHDDIEHVDFGGEQKVYLNEIHSTEFTAEVC